MEPKAALKSQRLVKYHVQTPHHTPLPPKREVIKYINNTVMGKVLSYFTEVKVHQVLSGKCTESTECGKLSLVIVVCHRIKLLKLIL